jgi:hypothetical protein
MKIACYLLALAALGCSKNDDKETGLIQDVFHDQTYYLVESGNLERSESLLKGSGAMVFASPLDAISSQDNFTLEFSLAEGGSLALVTHSNNSLEKGITVQFDRAGTQLSTSLKADGSGTSDIVLEGLDASGTLTLSVDVHNNETPTHVLIWNAAQGSYDESDAVFNSEEDEASPGVGQGSLWGLVLRQAELKSVTRGEAKFKED